MRCAFIISYNGSSFLGSQAQKSSPNTILGTLERVFVALGIDSKVIASGRTDKGVHATGQVCHVDLPHFWDNLKRLKKVLNTMLPPSIKVLQMKTVDINFHARYSAKKRLYRYIIKNSQSNPFEDEFITFLDDFDFIKVQKNIKLFIGEHDFTNFMKNGSDTKSAIRIIYNASTYKYKDYIILTFEANGFLRTQIRLMVGALLSLDAQQIEEKLKCKTNHKVKPAPSNGLYLARIKY